MNGPRPWAIIGNPENRRVTLFQQALASRGVPPATVLGYHDLLSGQASLANVPPRAMVRLESPGENFRVEQSLLAAGAEAAAAEGGPSLSPRQVWQLAEDPGRILYPRQWYLGFTSTCARWLSELEQRGDCLLLTRAADLETMFHKNRCQQVCGAAGVPIPRPLGSIFDWDELHALMQAEGVPRVFVKLSHGSSASGVVALHVRGPTIEAITSAELVRAAGEVRLYNSLRIRRYTALDDVRDLIDALAPHRVHVEAWLPKASLDRRVFDLRVLAVQGQARQMVVRTSRSPLTNLHLGNQRGSLDEVLAKIPPSVAEAMRQTILRCANIFPHSLHLGLDILLTPGFRRHYLLEVNAFGDLLPGVLHQGSDAYQSQIDAVPSFLVSGPLS